MCKNILSIKKYFTENKKNIEKLDIWGTHQQINFKENIELKKNRNCQKNRIKDEAESLSLVGTFLSNIMFVL